jgi:arylsulfatase A-like enzyme
MSWSLPDSLFLDALAQGGLMALLVAAVVSAVLMVKSLLDFTRTGPEMAEEVLTHYRLYLAASLGRLLLAAFAVTAFLALPGVVLYAALLVLLGASYQPMAAFGVAILSVALLTCLRFMHTLHLSPGIIAASSLYSMTHFHPLWRMLSSRRLRVLDGALFAFATALVLVTLVAMARHAAWLDVSVLAAVSCLYTFVGWLATRDHEPAPMPALPRANSRPNILLIGSDTLRFDRLSGAGYPRELTPNLARLAKRATLFTDCYVPCARTAPSLVSLLSGTWPHTHGVRDTFVTPEQTRLAVPALPQILKMAGYQSAIVGDWAASDADKFSFGFDHRDLPHDQWNIKFLLRQGPKDLRLFLSLFTQNPLGKLLLPEIYYLGGIPLTEEVGRDTRRMIGRMAREDKPFFLMSFMATTHPPFTSKYPYYSLFSDPDYQGESKFIMAKLRDPWEIIRAQAEPRSKFDLDQVIDLYDGCVRNFDDEVERILAYLKASRLAENTIVVIFSDHGFEFFEHETWGQGNSAIGDFSARVPIIIADPRIARPERVNDVVRTVDIAPTLLELAGVPIPGSMEGASLTQLIRGEPLGTELPAFYETGVWLTDLPGTPDGHLRYPHLPELLEVPDKSIGMISMKPKYFDIVIEAKDRMVRKGKWKLTYQPLNNGAIYRLFDIENDTACRNNLIDRYPAVAAELRSLLDQWMADDPQSSRIAAQSRRAAAADADAGALAGSEAAVGKDS